MQLHTNKQETSPISFEAYLPEFSLTHECVKILSVAQRMPEVAGVHQADHGGGVFMRKGQGNLKPLIPFTPLNRKIY